MIQGIEIFLKHNNATLILFSTTVTALATAALFYATWVLARETKILSKATAQPHVTVGIEPNQWALIYFDLIVRNSGNAPAYDIKISFDPPPCKFPKRKGGASKLDKRADAVSRTSKRLK